MVFARLRVHVLLALALSLPGCGDDSGDDGGSADGSAGSGGSDGDDGGTAGSDADGTGDGSGSGGEGSDGESGDDGGSDGGSGGDWGACVWACSTDADCCVDDSADCPGASPNNVRCADSGACLRELCETDDDCRAAHDDAWACLVFDGYRQCHVPCTPETDCLSHGFDGCGGADLDGTEYCVSWGPTNPPGEYMQCESDDECDGMSSGLWGGIGLKCNDSTPSWTVCGCQSDADCLDEDGWSCMVH